MKKAFLSSPVGLLKLTSGGDRLTSIHFCGDRESPAESYSADPVLTEKDIQVAAL